MTSPTGFAGRLRPVVPAAKKGTPTSRVGLRHFPRRSFGVYRSQEIDHAEVVGGGWDHRDLKVGRHER